MFKNALKYILYFVMAFTVLLTGCSISSGSGSESNSSSNVDLSLPITQIVLSESEQLTLLVGDRYELTATAYIENEECMSAVLTWESSDLSVASVKNGKITANGGGYATISASYGEIKQSINIFVAQRITERNVW